MTIQKNNFKKLKRVVVKEEFVALTGDFIKAVILNQFVYWSERTEDFDQFILEEKNRARQEGLEINIQLTKGWIYKKAEELSEETMLNLAPNTMLRHVKVLLENGWLNERQNPEYRWDRTRQYRVNLTKIYSDLLELGYVLQDYKMEVPFSKMENAESMKMDDGISKIENANSIMDVRKSKMENGDSKMDFHSSKMENQIVQNGRAIPKITTDISCCCSKTENELLPVVDKFSEVEIKTVIEAAQNTKGVVLSKKYAMELLSKFDLGYILQKIYVVIAPMKIKDSYEGTLMAACQNDWHPNNKPTTEYKHKKRNKKSGESKNKTLYDALLMS